MPEDLTGVLGMIQGRLDDLASDVRELRAETSTALTELLRDVGDLRGDVKVLQEATRKLCDADEKQRGDIGRTFQRLEGVERLVERGRGAWWAIGLSAAILMSGFTLGIQIYRIILP